MTKSRVCILNIRRTTHVTEDHVITKKKKKKNHPTTQLDFRTMKVLVLLGVLLCFVEWSTSIPSDFVFPPLKNGGKNWALLVAGSNGWGNYRHQVTVLGIITKNFPINYQVLQKDMSILKSFVVQF